MVSAGKNKRRTEFGDFQTPKQLARELCALLARHGINPESIVEPTCGTGSILVAALEQFPGVKCAIGLDINSGYVSAACDAVRSQAHARKLDIRQGDFFETDWEKHLSGLPEPILVVGNPPWVTNAELGLLGSRNLPNKANDGGEKGLDAITGKSNFDISEWMLKRLLDVLNGRSAVLAMLCKTGVARKTMVHAWKSRMGVKNSFIYRIDASRHFDAAVDACLLVCSFTLSERSTDCMIYSALEEGEPEHRIGYRDGRLVADVSLYDRWKHLQGDEIYKWRSGVKHDCAKVMELSREGSQYRNGLGELVELDDEYVFPMLKSSDLANGRTTDPRRWMLVTQKTVGDETDSLRLVACKTWNYLSSHAEFLDRRASTVYRSRPRFSIFGVGPYSFAPWKVAISGFYKRLEFRVVGTKAGKPILLDDTSYFVACRTEREAKYVASLLNSPTASEFFRAFVFWDAKRPITVDLLRRLDLLRLAREMGSEDTMLEYIRGFDKRLGQRSSSIVSQGQLFSGAAHCL